LIRKLVIIKNLCQPPRIKRWRPRRGQVYEGEIMNREHDALAPRRPDATGQQPDEPFLVGISGVQGAGKTILAELLADSLRRGAKLDVRRRALADPLREMAEALTGDPHFHKSRAYALGLQGAPMFGREILQRLGTDICREAFRPDIWVYLLQRWAEQSGAAVVVVDDVRFPDESAACGFRIYLESPDHPEQEGAHHASESHLAALRAAADLVISRSDGRYSAPLSEVAARLVEAMNQRSLLPVGAAS
jgi:hypothetical protein